MQLSAGARGESCCSICVKSVNNDKNNDNNHSSAFKFDRV